jgi:hypothetical protein
VVERSTTDCKIEASNPANKHHRAYYRFIMQISKQYLK